MSTDAADDDRAELIRFGRGHVHNLLRNYREAMSPRERHPSRFRDRVSAFRVTGTPIRGVWGNFTAALALTTRASGVTSIQFQNLPDDEG